MQIATSSWVRARGWSPALPALDSPATLVLVFGHRSAETDLAPLQELGRAFPSSVVLGCSTSGQVLGPAVLDEELVAAVVRFDSTRLRSAAADITTGTESFAAGETLGHHLAGEDLRAVFVLSDGLRVNGSELVSGLLSGVGDDVVVTGGLAADGDRFERTWVVEGASVRSGRAVAVGLYGDRLRVGTGSRGGWGIFGPERVVTRSTGNVLFELDGRPALELYERYLGELSAGLPASALLFPLAVRPDGRSDQLVRTVLAVDRAEQSMTFAGDIPAGWRAQLMRSSMDRLIDGAAGAAAAAAQGHPGTTTGPVLGIAISCVGRRLVLGERTDEEVEATLEALPSGSRLVGFYSYGEIAPGGYAACDLHNQTMTVTTLAED